MSWMVVHFNIPLKKKSIITYCKEDWKMSQQSPAKIYCNKRMGLEQLGRNETKHMCLSLFSHGDSFHQPLHPSLNIIFEIW